MGIPSVTTNLSGFGCFMQCIIKDSPQSYGIYVVDRRHQGADGSVQDLAEMMLDFSHMSRRQRIIQRNRTERLSDILDWKQLGVFYRRAREMALHKKYPNKKDALEEDDEPLHMSRPASEPPSPTRSRSSTPAPSEVDSDDVDSDEEREELGLPPNLDAGISMLTPDHSPRSLSDMSPLLILDGPPGAPMPGDDIASKTKLNTAKNSKPGVKKRKDKEAAIVPPSSLSLHAPNSLLLAAELTKTTVLKEALVATPRGAKLEDFSESVVKKEPPVVYKK